LSRFRLNNLPIPSRFLTIWLKYNSRQTITAYSALPCKRFFWCHETISAFARRLRRVGSAWIDC